MSFKKQQVLRFYSLVDVSYSTNVKTSNLQVNELVDCVKMQKNAVQVLIFFEETFHVMWFDG